MTIASLWACYPKGIVSEEEFYAVAKGSELMDLTRTRLALGGFP